MSEILNFSIEFHFCYFFESVLNLTAEHSVFFEKLLKKLPGYLSRIMQSCIEKNFYSDIEINVELGQVYIIVSIFTF